MDRTTLQMTIADVLEVAPDDLHDGTVLADLDSYDSVAALSLMVALGDELGVPVGPEEIAGLRTYGDIVELVRGKGSLSE